MHTHAAAAAENDLAEIRSQVQKLRESTLQRARCNCPRPSAMTLCKKFCTQTFPKGYPARNVVPNFSSKRAICKKLGSQTLPKCNLQEARLQAFPFVQLSATPLYVSCCGTSFMWLVAFLFFTVLHSASRRCSRQFSQTKSK
eukprot:TRINITY_DN3157_c0_g1_i5.p2 TRINITY_DN3157_c0_g1~~TRINITY_DN3157_c0_g1_i5.p2  ORF type:complete len:142 (+),score=16.21 TRINITY_DN3157_c0_g1_i5:640-1065(+)